MKNTEIIPEEECFNEIDINNIDEFTAENVREIEYGMLLALTHEDIQEMNGTISAYKEDYFSKRSEAKNIIIILIIIIAFSMLFSIKYTFLFVVPFFILLSFFGYKLYKVYRRIKLSKIIITDLERCKKEWIEYHYSI